MAGHKYRGPDVVAPHDRTVRKNMSAEGAKQLKALRARQMARQQHAVMRAISNQTVSPTKPRRGVSGWEYTEAYEAAGGRRQRPLHWGPLGAYERDRTGRVTRTYPRSSPLRKRLVDEERHTSIPRLLATGAGMGAIAWGGSRFKVLGRGLRLGATHPDIKVGLRRAFHTAELARSSTERVTSPLGVAAGRGYGHLPANVRASLDNVPPSLRPATSALVGAIMVENSRPIRRTTYRPVGID